VIDNYATYALSLIDDFSIKNKDPHIAISVDMLDTGIDVPEVANLVFFKPVLFEDQVLADDRPRHAAVPGPVRAGDGQEGLSGIFDFCYNFDFFKMNPDGIERGGGMPLGARLFRSRVELVGHTQRTPALDPDDKVRTPTTNLLPRGSGSDERGELHRAHAPAGGEQVQGSHGVGRAERRRSRDAYTRKSAGTAERIPGEEIESRLFDLMALRMQLATVEHDVSGFEKDRKKVVEIAMLLEEKSAIPAVKGAARLSAGDAGDGLLGGDHYRDLEEMRLRLRELVPLLDKTKRHIVFTDFEDEIIGVNEGRDHRHPENDRGGVSAKGGAVSSEPSTNIVIHRLRTNQPLTAVRSAGAEKDAGQDRRSGRRALLKGLLAQSKAPVAGAFRRGLVGMDRAAAQAAFSKLLSNQSLSPPQIRFVEMIIEQLTARGVIEPGHFMKRRSRASMRRPRRAFRRSKRDDRRIFQGDRGDAAGFSSECGLVP
jgi:type I restriction enzyme R subunit